MFLLPPAADRRWRARMSEFAGAGVEALYQAVEPELEWLEVPYGNVLVFTHTMMHGNRVNVEPTTRWSIWCRPNWPGWLSASARPAAPDVAVAAIVPTASALKSWRLP